MKGKAKILTGHILISVRPAEDFNTYLVSLPTGVPDFRIKAKDAKSAIDALADYIYNELDGREDISDGEVEDA